MAALRDSGVPTAKILSEHRELTAVDVKLARIASCLKMPTLLAHPELLTRPEHAELVRRLHELAALLEAEASRNR